VPDLATAYRRYLIFAPGKLLYSTDAGNYPGVPVGPEVQHLAIARAAREALYLALAGLVRDGVLTRDQAVATGEGVLAGNARRQYGLRYREPSACALAPARGIEPARASAGRSSGELPAARRGMRRWVGRSLARVLHRVGPRLIAAVLRLRPAPSTETSWDSDPRHRP